MVKSCYATKIPRGSVFSQKVAMQLKSLEDLAAKRTSSKQLGYRHFFTLISFVFIVQCLCKTEGFH